MENKARNIFLIIVSAILFVGPMAHLAQVLVSGETLTSQLEARNVSLAKLSLTGFMDGDAQDTVDNALVEAVPFHDSFVLAHAFSQRLLIAPTANVFGYNAYPTYYGSSYFHLTDYDSVIGEIGTTSQEKAADFQTLADQYNSAFSANKDVNWYFALVDSDAVNAPLRQYRSNTCTYAFFEEHFLSRISDNCTVVNLDFDSDNPFDYYFRTDHHWNINGAIQAYKRIAKAMSIDPVQFSQPYMATEAEFLGSFARRGLDTSVAPEPVYDVMYDRSSFDITVNGKTQLPAFLDSGAYYVFLGAVFHG